MRTHHVAVDRVEAIQRGPEEGRDAVMPNELLAYKAGVVLLDKVSDQRGDVGEEGVRNSLLSRASNARRSGTSTSVFSCVHILLILSAELQTQTGLNVNMAAVTLVQPL
jgi:hypothetical protein